MAISQNTVNVFNYIKNHSAENLTLDKIGEAIGLTAKQVNGSAVGLQKKGLIYRVDATLEFEDGSTKNVKFLKVTDAGLETELAAE